MSRMTAQIVETELRTHDLQGLETEIGEHHLSLWYPHGYVELQHKAEKVGMTIAMKADLSIQVYDHEVRLNF